MWQIVLYSGGVAALGVAGLLLRRGWNRQKAALEAQIRQERERGHHLCFSTIEALSAALEASWPDHQGHQERVLQCVTRLSRLMDVEPDEAMALRAAALLHTIGRLGVPESILNKPGKLTPEEQEKLRMHPVLGARILASIPFPWPVVALVRSQAEYWDGSGYPDGLKGTEIPLGARILSVANAYSALLQPRPYRPAMSPVEALAQIEARSGSQFDPAVVAAFRMVAAEIRADSETGIVSLEDASNDREITVPARRSPASLARAALQDISAAQRETRGLRRLAEAVSQSLHLEAVCDTILKCTREILPCSACALFLYEESEGNLRAYAAQGTNERHLLGSVARAGTFLTGRAFSRGEIVRASFLAEDLLLRDVSDPWVAFRSTLIVPLFANGIPIGTLNLYSEMPEAFDTDSQRVMRLVATQAGKALENVRRFADVQENAYTDALTGLRNARFLREYLEREMNRALREQSSLAVLNLDLDNFKPINDRCGHARGDQTLRDVADILQSLVRNYDLAARYAGDEFVVVLARAGAVEAEVVATKIKIAVERYSERHKARDPEFPGVGISIGVALYPNDALDMQSLLQRADGAMYADKNQRRIETVLGAQRPS
jgi:diguanylate cyclase (GGDEF)-like protein